MSADLNEIIIAVLAMAFIIVFLKVLIKAIKELHNLDGERDAKAQKAGKQGSKKGSESLKRKATRRHLNRSTKRRDG